MSMNFVQARQLMALIHHAIAPTRKGAPPPPMLHPGMFMHSPPRMPTPGKRMKAAGRRAGKQCRHGKAGRS